MLRAAVTDRFSARGLPTTPEQILVTAGARHAIALVLTALTGPGDRVLVERPSYPNALDAVRARGGRCVPVALDAPEAHAAWDLGLFTAAVRDAAPRLAYLIPDFQNPTGALMPDASIWAGRSWNNSSRPGCRPTSRRSTRPAAPSWQPPGTICSAGWRSCSPVGGRRDRTVG